MIIQQFPREPAGAQGIFGGIAAGGVRQNCELIGRNDLQQIGFARRLADVGPANGNRHDLRAAARDRLAGFFHGFVLAGSDQQAGVIRLSCNQKRVALGAVSGCRRSRRCGHDIPDKAQIEESVRV